MTTEQSPADSDIEGRLTSFYGGGEPEAAPEPEEAAEVVEAQDETPEDDQQPEDEEDASLLEIDLGDGEIVKGPAKLKELAEAGKDYTVKTQRLASAVKAVEDRAYFVEAKEQLSGAVQSELAEYKALEIQLERYKGLDWSVLYDTNPGQALQLREQRDELTRTMQEKASAIQQKAAHMQQMTAKHRDNQWEMAVKGARERIGTLTPKEDAAMLDLVQSLQFTQDEVKTRLADARILEIVNMAAKWKALQSGKAGSIATAQKAPPVVKPGVSKGFGAQSQSKYKDARQALKKSGDLRDAARLFMLKG